ncbi:MAG: alpha/beta hydrolase [Myxococcota bacterium]|nr:alpha/beta hydrolase [Myxococcota bacterium]
MFLRVTALHGLPTSPRLFERLALGPGWEVQVPQLEGLIPGEVEPNWSLASCAESVREEVREADLIVGHDLGGVLAAMLAAPGQQVVLSGTALGWYWAAIRFTAWPGLRTLFYRKYAGSRFLSRGCLPEHVDSLLAAFESTEVDWSTQMEGIARGMKPPARLSQRLRHCDVHLVWGRLDPWYPPVIARKIQRDTGARLHWLECGHFAPWEDPVGFQQALHAARRDALK